MNDITVAITSFHRASYLDRALKSIVAAGFTNIVVANAESDPEVVQVLAKYPQVKAAHVEDDLGCHFLWELAAYHCKTKRIIIVHNDDVLAPELGNVYQQLIKPEMDSGRVQFASWRAHLLHDSGRVQPTEWFHGPTRLASSGPLRDFLLQAGRLSLSPIISILDRNTLIGALKEGRQYLPTHEACLLHQGMLLGSEIIVYLRHCASFNKWMYIDQVLSLYGCCESSGTVKAQKTGNLRHLTTGYDMARNYFRMGAYMNHKPEPRILLVYDDVEPRDEDERRRFANAMFSWKFHFGQGDVIEMPTHVRQWKRSSADMGDTRAVPYFRDLIDYGVAHAMPEDVVVYANRDAGLTTLAPEQIIHTVRQHGVAAAWRRSLTPKPGRLYKHVTNARKDGGVDVVAVTPSWWVKNRDALPDVLIGKECFDWIFRVMAEEMHGKGIYMDDVCWHEPHDSFWKTHRKTNPGQIHNRELAKLFFTKRQDRKALVSLS